MPLVYKRLRGWFRRKNSLYKNILFKKNRTNASANIFNIKKIKNPSFYEINIFKNKISL